MGERGFNQLGEALVGAVEGKAVEEVALTLADVASQVETLDRFVEGLMHRMETVERSIRLMFWTSVAYGVAWLAGALWIAFR